MEEYLDLTFQVNICIKYSWSKKARWVVLLAHCRYTMRNITVMEEIENKIILKWWRKYKSQIYSSEKLGMVKKYESFFWKI